MWPCLLPGIPRITWQDLSLDRLKLLFCISPEEKGLINALGILPARTSELEEALGLTLSKPLTSQPRKLSSNFPRSHSVSVTGLR